MSEDELARCGFLTRQHDNVSVHPEDEVIADQLRVNRAGHASKEADQYLTHWTVIAMAVAIDPTNKINLGPQRALYDELVEATNKRHGRAGSALGAKTRKHKRVQSPQHHPPSGQGGGGIALVYPNHCGPGLAGGDVRGKPDEDDEADAYEGGEHVPTCAVHRCGARASADMKSIAGVSGAAPTLVIGLESGSPR